MLVTGCTGVLAVQQGFTTASIEIHSWVSFAVYVAMKQYTKVNFNDISL